MPSPIIFTHSVNVAPLNKGFNNYLTPASSPYTFLSSTDFGISHSGSSISVYKELKIVNYVTGENVYSDRFCYIAYALDGSGDFIIYNGDFPDGFFSPDGYGQYVVAREIIIGLEEPTYTLWGDRPAVIPSYTADLPIGIYKITYTANFQGQPHRLSSYSGTLAIADNRLPLKKWTVTDVINRCLELAEPLRKGQNPRFRLDGVEYVGGVAQYPYRAGSLAEKYDKIIAPEFAMTKQTLREQLKQVGGFIHAEPRLKDGVIYYDEYGKNSFSNISKKKHISAQLSHDINEFCTSLDSQADNLVNRLDYAQGVVIEPFVGGFQSIRTESTTVRIGEGNGIIATQRPIMDIKRVLVRYPTQNSNGAITSWSNPVDITAYLFESAEYSNLSSFSGTFPYAKEWALCYIQGQKNITGLFYKAPDAVGEAVESYSIVNILGTEGVSKANIEAVYPILAFEVSYVPTFSERVKTNKAIRIGGLPRTLVYNQSANLVESRYYGENLKGVVARLGNIDKTYTYKIGYLSDIPKAGDLFDKDYYISAVSVEIQPFFIKLTVGLSKDFNRLSEYVGISSNIRMYEISEKQAFQRDTVYTDYLVVTDNLEENNLQGNDLGSNDLAYALYGMFTGYYDKGYRQINQALIKARSIENKSVNQGYAISLPVVSSALGNQMTFSFNCEDNYSAGQQVDYSNINNGGISGFFGNYVPYTDYYGRAYYLDVALYQNQIIDEATNKRYPLRLPLYELGDKDKLPTNSVVTTDDYPILYRKDSREVVSFTYQISIVAGKNDTDIIIGSGFAKNCSLVNGNTIKNEFGETIPLKIYFFNERLPQYEKVLDINQETKFIKLNNDIVEVQTSGARGVRFKSFTAPSDFKSWAIATPIKVQKVRVNDEANNEIIQEIITGGELILGKNISGKEGDEVKLPSLYFTHDIYDRW